ncbi:stage II sporulation protein D [Thermoanaerobacter mathranii subsp. mathranii str. A3]|jgi:stage II sporulation protein D|uniref:Stage II sporulation protein D n=1 Tax=Thermoanaerobacter mathranii subsp. mathranii (strain DSM 11426 / CCUG 53645 / CIP 108742 / A3) TaxID=583358 RepID=A0ABN3YZ23_THEM3|nr:MULTISPECIES: stage II sporulation protein D [Thermoanaerobacter]ADH59980.1 stage II sporulation protein D [Thermoanaerobacter mathranii subsp. mathranii str. A3]MBT1279117.1 stage II sporulation protein D [Thermoanaerobacter sp. CM-CNRG TB177]
MKYAIYGVFLIFFSLIILPSIIVFGFNPHRTSSTPENEVKLIDGGNLVKVDNLNNKDYHTVNVFITNQNKIQKIDLEEYVKGVVAAEMPAEFEIEALKAQAVTARTYVLSKEIVLGGKGCQLHPGADVCTDSEHCQAWQSEEELRQKWGENFDKYYVKISQAVADTEELVLVYNDALIVPAYHAISGGKTENSEDVWQSKIPYLRSVVSPGEEVASKYKTTVVMSKEEFINKLKQKKPSLKLDNSDILNQIKDVERTQAGHIKTLKIGNMTFGGEEIREIFDLNSTNFNFEAQGNNIVITVIGYGHGVGMSQYGANALAKQGKKFDEILKYYYTGVEIVKIEDLLKIQH